MSKLVPSGRGGEVARWDGAGRPPHTSQHGRPPSGDNEGVDLRELLGVLRRQAWLLVVCTVITLGTATVLVLRHRPEYRATATIRLKDEREAMTGAIDAPGFDQMFGTSTDPLLSQLEVMRSRSVTGEVVRRTGLRLVWLDEALPFEELTDVSVAPNATADTLHFRFLTDGYTVRRGRVARRAAYGQSVELAGIHLTVAAAPVGVSSTRVAILGEQGAIRALQQRLRASQLEKTDVVEVAYTDLDPHRARAVVNTAVGVFQDANATAAQQLSRRRRLFVEEQLGKTDSILAVAQAGLSAFRSREGVFSSREKFATQQTGMLELEMQRELLNTERRVHARLLQALRGGSSSSLEAFVAAPGISENPVIATLYEQLVRYQAARDSLTTGRWGRAATNPDVQRLDALIASAQAGLVRAAAGQLSAIDTRLGALGELQRRNEAGLEPDKEAEEMRLVRRVETAGRLADQLREEYQKAQIAEAVEVGQVEIIDLAPLPEEPIPSRGPLKLALGLAFGLLLGSGAAFLREHLNNRITRKDEMEIVLGVPGLGMVPRLTMPERGNGNGGPPLRLPVRALPAKVERPLEALVTVTDERSVGAEAYRSLRTNLLFSSMIQQLKSMMITSPAASEGKTTTAANLSVAFAQQGVRVLLLEGDLRKARLHSVFGLSRNPGLTDAIAGTAELDDIVRPSGVEGLSIVTAGNLPHNPAELLGSELMRQLLEQLKTRADLLIVDAAPVLVAGDASIMGRMVDGVVVVVRAGQTERATARAAMDQLHTVGVRVLGAVLNDPDAKVPSYDRYSYYSYDYYGAEG